MRSWDSWKTGRFENLFMGRGFKKTYHQVAVLESGLVLRIESTYEDRGRWKSSMAAIEANAAQRGRPATTAMLDTNGLTESEMYRMARSIDLAGVSSAAEAADMSRELRRKAQANRAGTMFSRRDTRYQSRAGSRRRPGRNKV